MISCVIRWGIVSKAILVVVSSRVLTKTKVIRVIRCNGLVIQSNGLREW